jgi:hypothetical protein
MRGREQQESREAYDAEFHKFVFLTKLFQGNEINENGMVTRCSNSGGEDKSIQNWEQKPEGRRIF